MGVKRVLTKSAHYDVTLDNAFELFTEDFMKEDIEELPVQERDFQ